MRISKGRAGSLSATDKAAQQDRAKAFRRAHQVGDVVRGRLTRWAAEGLAWVSLDGQPLLARLPAETPVGAPLAFQVTALAPEIVLKRLSGQGGGVGHGQLVAGFVAARAAFEAAWRASGITIQALSTDGFAPDHTPPVNTAPKQIDNGDQAAPADRLAVFLAAVGGDPHTTRTFAAVQAAVAALNRVLPQGSRLAYPPWLAPALLSQGRDLELMVTRKQGGADPFVEAALSGVLGGSHSGPGAFQVRLMVLGQSDGQRAGVRVLAERPDFDPGLADRLSQAVAATISPCLNILSHGLEPLPRQSHGGVLSELGRP